MEAFNATGGNKVNQLGGKYVSGKPLPLELRSRIITLSYLGLRQCEISRQLKVTHGCISKLLSKYQESGNVDPVQNTGRPRVITADIERRIDQYRTQDPGAFCWELREHLLRDNVCSTNQIPSLSSISRLIKNKIIHEAVEQRERGAELPAVIKEKTFTPFSIANILNIDNDTNMNRQHVELEEPCTKNHQIYSDIAEKNVSSDRNTPPVQTVLPDNEASRPRRRVRTRFNRAQTIELEREFLKNPYPGIQGRIILAYKLDIDESRIQVWFANRRARGRRRVAGKDNGPSTDNSQDKLLMYPRDDNLSSNQKRPFLHVLSQKKNRARPFNTLYI
ncbi:paired box protein Pax-3-like [Montipora capricornis]|uniref:paired box protein Pax-3-like n=1 Tax=Montipora capricornis TaxID=246305 RepID=UPI0035F1B59E